MQWHILIDEGTGELTTLWHDDICPVLIAQTRTEPSDGIYVERVGDVEYEPQRGGWTARDHATGELLDNQAFSYRRDAVEAERYALFTRMGA